IVRWQTFTYDCENRLVKTETMADTQVESTSSYQYDSLGRRVGKQSEIKGQSDHKRFLWQGLRMLREESPGQSSLYLYEPGSYAPLARVDEKEGETENKVYYYHTDQIGTPLEMTDADGQIVWQAKYRAWGAIEKLVVNEVEQNLRFQGQYFDVETGLHYNTFRYYDPEIGRFTTQDPIGLAGGFNLYQYAPNPQAWLDPLGLSSCNGLPSMRKSGGSGSKYYSVNGQGLYVLHAGGKIKYVGRGDASVRLNVHASTPGKSSLEQLTVFDNNLSKAEAKFLEQKLIGMHGGAQSMNPLTNLLNKIRSFSTSNPNASMYKVAGDSSAWGNTILKDALSVIKERI
ncbi:RHS repeat domain-containing protein, partial [Pseudomonas syringae group genomosp. 3]